MRKSIMLVMSLLMTISMVYGQKPSGYNLKNGDKFSVTKVNKVTTIQEAMGQTIETKEEDTNMEELEVIAVNGDVYTIKVTSIRKIINISSPMMSQVVDTEQAGPQNAPFKKMIGKSFSFKMDKKGQVLELLGLDNMKAAMRKEMMAGQFPEATEDLLSVYEYNTVKNKLEDQFAIYNNGAGGTWSKKSTVVTSSVPVEVTTNYRWDNDKTILAQADMVVNSSVNMGGMDIKFALSGDQKTIIDLDPSNGLPSKTQVIQELKGSMNAQNTDIPMTATTETTTTVVKK